MREFLFSNIIAILRLSDEVVFSIILASWIAQDGEKCVNEENVYVNITLIMLGFDSDLAKNQ